MSYRYIQDYYKVPAETGRRVEIANDPPIQGVIVGNNGHYIQVWLDGEKKPHGYYHPTDRIKYLGMGAVPKLSRSKARYQRYINSEVFENFRQFLAYEKEEKEAKKCGFDCVREYHSWLNSAV